MTDEKEETEQPAENKPVDIVSEARAIRDEIRAEREKLEAANAESKKIQAEKMLSGDSGGHIDSKPAPEETAKDYADKVMSGKKND